MKSKRDKIQSRYAFGMGIGIGVMACSFNDIYIFIGGLLITITSGIIGFNTEDKMKSKRERRRRKK